MRRTFRALEHKDYTLGLLYFMGHDSRVSEGIRNEMLRWGLPKDEFAFNGHWTPQLYVRETRRMCGEYTATQHDCEGRVQIADGVGLAAYTMDSHNCQRIVVVKDGQPMVKNEGDVEIRGGAPYPISYRSLTPKREECSNLLVPVCLCASHIAYGSIRMEPVFMVLGQSAGMAAAMSLGKGGRRCHSVQELDVAALQELLGRDPCLDGSAPDIIMDDDSPLVHPGQGWERIQGRRGYGPSFLELEGGMEDSEGILYSLPDTLAGPYAIYAYVQLKGELNPAMTFTVNAPDGASSAEFSKDALSAEGQTSGEWFKICERSFSPGDSASVHLHASASALPARADALMLIRQWGATLRIRSPR